MYWLPADLADLYFDWPAFSMTCLSSVIFTLVHGLRDIHTMKFSQHDIFRVTKFVLEYANKGKLITLPMGFLERDMSIRFVEYAWQCVNQEVQREVKGSKIWWGDAGLARALERSVFVREVLGREGEFGRAMVYKGWKRVDRRKSVVWRSG
jgi:hypothetical protein